MILNKDYNINQFSNRKTIVAYSDWSQISDIETRYLDKYIAEGADVLDIGCGAGRVAGFLQSKNVKYVGIDVIPEMISNAKKNHLELTFKCVDAFNYKTNMKFNVILLMHNVIDMI